MPHLNRRTVRSLLARSRPSRHVSASASSAAAGDGAVGKVSSDADGTETKTRCLQQASTTSTSMAAATAAALAETTLTTAATTTIPQRPSPGSPSTLSAVTARQRQDSGHSSYGSARSTRPREAGQLSSSSSSSCSSPSSTSGVQDTTHQSTAHGSQPPHGSQDAATRQAMAEYLEAGILPLPLAQRPQQQQQQQQAPSLPASASWPVSDRLGNTEIPFQSPATGSPLYQFDGLFAVPTMLPIQQQQQQQLPQSIQASAQQPDEEAMVSPTSSAPFHQNGSPEYQLPGNDCFPRLTGTRTVNGSWLGGRFERFTVGGRTFFCPVHLMLRYPHWRLLLSLERPAQGWVLSPAVDATIFGLVMEALVSPAGFDGTEPGLNLVKLALACRQAHEWAMDREVTKLAASFGRYVARRLFYRNPHRPDLEGVMDHNYFAYRSEELYRTWRALKHFPHALRERLPIPPIELVLLYTLAVPCDLWPALTADFADDEFARLLDLSARIRAVPEAVDYHDWWLRFFRRAGCLDFDWIADVPAVLDMFFQSHQEVGAEAGAATSLSQQDGGQS